MPAKVTNEPKSEDSSSSGEEDSSSQESSSEGSEESSSSGSQESGSQTSSVINTPPKKIQSKKKVIIDSKSSPGSKMRSSSSEESQSGSEESGESESSSSGESTPAQKQTKKRPPSSSGSSGEDSSSGSSESSGSSQESGSSTESNLKVKKQGKPKQGESQSSGSGTSSSGSSGSGSSGTDSSGEESESSQSEASRSESSGSGETSSLGTDTDMKRGSITQTEGSAKKRAAGGRDSANAGSLIGSIPGSVHADEPVNEPSSAKAVQRSPEEVAPIESAVIVVNDVFNDPQPSNQQPSQKSKASLLKTQRVEPSPERQPLKKVPPKQSLLKTQVVHPPPTDPPLRSEDLPNHVLSSNKLDSKLSRGQAVASRATSIKSGTSVGRTSNESAQMEKIQQLLSKIKDKSKVELFKKKLLQQLEKKSASSGKESSQSLRMHELLKTTIVAEPIKEETPKRESEGTHSKKSSLKSASQKAISKHSKTSKAAKNSEITNEDQAKIFTSQAADVKKNKKQNSELRGEPVVEKGSNDRLSEKPSAKDSEKQGEEEQQIVQPEEQLVDQPEEPPEVKPSSLEVPVPQKQKKKSSQSIEAINDAIQNLDNSEQSIAQTQQLDQQAIMEEAQEDGGSSQQQPRHKSQARTSKLTKNSNPAQASNTSKIQKTSNLQKSLSPSSKVPSPEAISQQEPHEEPPESNKEESAQPSRQELKPPKVVSPHAKTQHDPNLMEMDQNPEGTDLKSVQPLARMSQIGSPPVKDPSKQTDSGMRNQMRSPLEPVTFAEPKKSSKRSSIRKSHLREQASTLSSRKIAQQQQSQQSQASQQLQSLQSRQTEKQLPQTAREVKVITTERVFEPPKKIRKKEASLKRKEFEKHDSISGLPERMRTKKKKIPEGTISGEHSLEVGLAQDMKSKFRPSKEVVASLPKATEAGEQNGTLSEPAQPEDVPQQEDLDLRKSEVVKRVSASPSMYTQDRPAAHEKGIAPTPTRALPTTQMSGAERTTDNGRDHGPAQTHRTSEATTHLINIQTELKEANMDRKAVANEDQDFPLELPSAPVDGLAFEETKDPSSIETQLVDLQLNTTPLKKRPEPQPEESQKVGSSLDFVQEYFQKNKEFFEQQKQEMNKPLSEIGELCNQLKASIRTINDLYTDQLPRMSSEKKQSQQSEVEQAYRPLEPSNDPIEDEHLHIVQTPTEEAVRSHQQRSRALPADAIPQLITPNQSRLPPQPDSLNQEHQIFDDTGNDLEQKSITKDFEVQLVTTDTKPKLKAESKENWFTNSELIKQEEDKEERKDSPFKQSYSAKASTISKGSGEGLKAEEFKAPEDSKLSKFSVLNADENGELPQILQDMPTKPQSPPAAVNPIIDNVVKSYLDHHTKQKEEADMMREYHNKHSAALSQLQTSSLERDRSYKQIDEDGRAHFFNEEAPLNFEDDSKQALNELVEKQFKVQLPALSPSFNMQMVQFQSMQHDSLQRILKHQRIQSHQFDDGLLLANPFQHSMSQVAANNFLSASHTGQSMISPRQPGDFLSSSLKQMNSPTSQLRASIPLSQNVSVAQHERTSFHGLSQHNSHRKTQNFKLSQEPEQAPDPAMSIHDKISFYKSKITQLEKEASVHSVVASHQTRLPFAKVQPLSSRLTHQSFRGNPSRAPLEDVKQPANDSKSQHEVPKKRKRLEGLATHRPAHLPPGMEMKESSFSIFYDDQEEAPRHMATSDVSSRAERPTNRYHEEPETLNLKTQEQQVDVWQEQPLRGGRHVKNFHTIDTQESHAVQAPSRKFIVGSPPAPGTYRAPGLKPMMDQDFQEYNHGQSRYAVEPEGLGPIRKGLGARPFGEGLRASNKVEYDIFGANKDLLSRGYEVEFNQRSVAELQNSGDLMRDSLDMGGAGSSLAGSVKMQSPYTQNMQIKRNSRQLKMKKGLSRGNYGQTNEQTASHNRLPSLKKPIGRTDGQQSRRQLNPLSHRAVAAQKTPQGSSSKKSNLFSPPAVKKNFIETNKKKVAEQEEYMKTAKIKKLEGDYLKLQKRYLQVIDPQYLSSLQKNLSEAERLRKEKLAQVKQLEIQQRQLDRKIEQQVKAKEKMIGRMHAGKVIDQYQQQSRSVKADIEVCQKKLDQQDKELGRLEGDQVELSKLVKDEQEKYEKLATIAEKKYQIDLEHADLYASDSKTGRKDLEKKALHKAEAKLLHSTKLERDQQKSHLLEREQSLREKEMKKAEKTSKLENLKIQLKRRAKESETVLEQARKMGTDEKEMERLMELNQRIQKLVYEDDNATPQVRVGEPRIEEH